RTHPIEEVLYCMIPNESDNHYTKFNDKSRIIFVHLSRFKDEKILKTISKMMKEWAEFFFDPKRIESEDDGMKDAQYLWTKLSSSEQIKAQIRAREKYEMDKASEIATAKNEGIEQGKKEGLIEGEKKGIEKGAQQKMKELALKMQSKGFDNDTIAECLNISIGELNALCN
ncbi:MAG: hypothetical protein IJ848_03525, partial [Alphaproteobacteria bacterium]|nr:hypothetical protein [Alphaproteobacteria bacterium]